MNHDTRRRALVTSTLLALAATASLAASRPEIFPLEDVRPGMRAVGRTVFEGDRVEEFDVEILGILKNALSPRRDIIFARLVGEKVEATGVASGMSGSPILIDGRLVGALSFRFGQFSKEALCGITPIEYMMALEGGPQGAGNPGGVPGGIPLADRAAIPNWGQELAKFVATRHETPFDAAATLRASAPSGTLQPIGATLSLGGFSDRALQQALPVFTSFGFAPAPAASFASVPAAALAPSEAPARLEPGSAVAVQLVRGHMDVSATGTVTWVDGEKLYAFGHQFFNFGRVSLPMASASVMRILSSPAGSLKVAAVGEPVGRFSQDRVSGIFGHVGPSAEMLPVKIAYADGAGAPITYEYEIAADPVIAPVLLQFSLQNVFHGADKDYGEKTLHVRGTIGVEGQNEVAVDNFFTGATAYNFASSYVAAFLSFLYGNEFAMPKVSSVSLEIEAREDVRLAEIASVVPSTYAVAPGDSVKLKVGIKPRRGDPSTMTYDVVVPEDAAPGPALLYVGEGRALGRLEAQTNPYAPKSMADVIDILSGLRRDNHVYASLSSSEGGISIEGRSLPGVPGSVQGILQADQGASRSSVPLVPLAEGSLATDYTIAGYRQIRIQIVPRPEL